MSGRFHTATTAVSDTRRGVGSRAFTKASPSLGRKARAAGGLGEVRHRADVRARVVQLFEAGAGGDFLGHSLVLVRHGDLPVPRLIEGEFVFVEAGRVTAIAGEVERHAAGGAGDFHPHVRAAHGLIDGVHEARRERERAAHGGGRLLTEHLRAVRLDARVGREQAHGVAQNLRK